MRGEGRAEAAPKEEAEEEEEDDEEDPGEELAGTAPGPRGWRGQVSWG